MRISCVYGLDETDRAYGYQILNSDTRVVKFFSNVYDKSQISLYQHFLCGIRLVVCEFVYDHGLLVGLQRGGKYLGSSNIIYIFAAFQGAQ